MEYIAAMREILQSTVFILLLIGSHSSAIASICFVPQPQEFLANTSLIFEGVVVSVEPIPTPPPLQQVEGPSGSPRPRTVSILGIGRPMIARFKIGTVIKGRANGVVAIKYYEPNGRNLGTTFRAGDTATVYAAGNERQGYFTDGCMMDATVERGVPAQGSFGTIQQVMGLPVPKVEPRRNPYAVELENYRASRDAFARTRAQQGASEQLLRDEALFFMKYRDLEEAEKALSELLALRPSDVFALLGRGKMRYHDANYDEALEDFRAVLDLDGKNTDAIKHLAHALVQSGRQHEIKTGQWDLSDFRPEPARQYDFSGLDLRGASFRNVQLASPDFSDANLTGADFTGANIVNGNFSGADLTDVKFEKLRYFSGNKFSASKLERTSFKNTAVAGANFDDATLSRVDFSSSSIERSDFRRGRLTDVNLKGACYYTRFSTNHWPQGFDIQAAGATICESEKKAEQLLKGMRGLFGK
jgi:uncharacterized protein YjbI with pentapeptide repeats